MGRGNTKEKARPVAMVTGATRGIGRAIAADLAGRGFDLVITGRSTSARPDKRLPGTLEEVEEEVARSGAAVQTVVADLSDSEGPGLVLRALKDSFGECDLLINNAAISYLGRFLEVGLDRWRKSTNLNLLSPVALAQGLLPGMIERGGGMILNISSRAAVDLNSPGLPYGVQKAGIERFTRGLARETAGTGVTVSCARIDGLVVTEAVQMVLPGSSRDDDLTPQEMATGLVWMVEHRDAVDGRVLTLDDLRTQGALPVRNRSGASSQLPGPQVE